MFQTWFNYLKDVLVRVLQSNLVRRAFHTAWQTGLVVWALSDFRVDYVSIGAAAGAALSAAKTIIVEAIQGYRS